MGTQGEAQQLANRIQTVREEAGLSLLSLATKSGLPYSTLHRKLTLAPDTLTVRDVIALALALNATFDAHLVRTP